MGVISNIIFILLSGYFLVKSKPKPKKIISLVIEMYFYSILFFLITKLFTNEQITLQGLKETFLPFPYGNWYVVMYIILYLISPFLNILIDNLKEKELKHLIIILAVLFSIVPFFTLWTDLSRLVIFFLGYFIGAYIRLYAKRYNKNKLLKIFLLLSITTVILVSSFYISSIIFNKPFLLKGSTYLLVANNSPFVISIAISIFLFFRELDIKQNKAINRIAASSLGIYLIHENVFVRPMIWNKIATININSVNIIQFIAFALLKCAIVFIICLLIDQTRIYVLDNLTNKKQNK